MNEQDRKIMEAFDFRPKMEDMTGESLMTRIMKAYEWEMPKLTMIPYIGEKGEVVEYRYPELIARCPVTGLPDTYDLNVRFIPDKYVPELKSYKMYLVGYFELPISHEMLASKVYKEFNEQVQPQQLEVILDVAVRGGIYTVVRLGHIDYGTDGR